MDWIKNLQKQSVKKLKDYTLWDFISISRSAFLDSYSIEKLDLLRRKYSDNYELLSALYVLAFVYRKTNYFKAIVLGDDILFMPSSQKVKEITHNKTQNEKQVHVDSDSMIFQVTTEERLFYFDEKVKNLLVNAEYFKEKMYKIFNKRIKIKEQKRKCKYEDVFKRIYEHEITKKANISQLLHSEADSKNIPYERLRRGYYRWKHNSMSYRPNDKTWPSNTFILFCAFLAVKYVPESSGSSRMILNEDFDPEVLCIYNNLYRKTKKEWFDKQLDQKYKNIMAYKDIHKKEEALKKLACQNHLEATKEYIEFAGNNKNQYQIRAAILGDNNYQKILGWEANGIRDFKLGVGVKKRLCVIGYSTYSSGMVIFPNTIIYSIKFPVEIAGYYNDAWQNVCHKFKGCDYEPIALFIPPPTDETKRKITCDWRMARVDATAENFNLLMKNAEKLNLYHIWLCFSSQHIDLAEDRYVELIREDKEKNEFFSKIKDLDKNK